jgi:hypothetical protein
MSRGSVRATCRGEIIGCEECRENHLPDGFCSSCARPFSKSIGEECGIVYAYVERGYVWKGKIRVKCRFCKTVNKI